MPPETIRHHDTGHDLTHYFGRLLVTCPNCSGQALILPTPGTPYNQESHYDAVFHPRRLTCTHCAAVADWTMRREGKVGFGVCVSGGTSDPFFGHPLWLQTPCAGHVLWAYNGQHVEDLRAYVAASLRERGETRMNSSMFSRLPLWMKAADNRGQVLAGLTKLHDLTAHVRR
ncbi:hypothetical protein Kisp01_66190 [Kineosporia sp. NBRC 101677]|uniref:hypothetical protein n=1 Tax=Kineosporia sp. NBRC 101677 TaxID=3032197 RepID=UPI0024A3B273|nr:hypothetical protein [Kineosporia sp. NBRC 101677]GLY19605.1 hypothetical protein Kisp01_66190 [Kineosporia sp. NBRC 101677]